MALSVNWSHSQVLGYPSKLYLTDSSTGTDAAVTGRRIYITDFNGDAVVQSGTTTTYELWGDFPATLSKTLDILPTSDKALLVRVDWVDSNGDERYSKETLIYCNLYAKTAYLNLIKSLQGNSKLKDVGGYFSNVIKLVTSIKQSEDAVNLLSDISSSQAALDRAKELIDNPSYFY